MLILGIDPSLRGTGWGLLKIENSRFEVLGFGVIQNKAALRPSLCLVAIQQKLSEVIAKFSPTEVAIEGIFYAQNIRTALMMGQARGIALLVAAQANLEIFEYAPRRVKQSMVGVGSATKNQVGFMVRSLLGLSVTPEADAADALAIALTHAQQRKGFQRKASL